jgi:hypothetical protein
MFSTELGIFGYENIVPAQIATAGGGVEAPPWPSWPVFIYAAVMFGFAFSMLRTAYNNVMAYHLALSSAESPISNMLAAPFLRSVVPDFGHWTIISLLMLASMVRPTIGSFFVGALLYAAALFVSRQFKPAMRSAGRG